MHRTVLRVAGTLLCLFMLPALATVAPAVHPVTPAKKTRSMPRAPAAGIEPVSETINAAIREVLAGQSRMPYTDWLATLPGFRFSPGTANRLATLFGTDRLLSVTRNALPADTLNYVMTVPTLRRDNPDGSRYAWSEMQAHLTVQPDGTAYLTSFNAPRIVAQGRTLSMEADATALSSWARTSNDLWTGESILAVGALSIMDRADGAGVRVDGLVVKSGSIDLGGTVDLFTEIGARTLTVQGVRIDDPHIDIHLNGLDRKAVQAFDRIRGQSANEGASGRQPSPGSAQQDPFMAPLMRQLGLALRKNGAAVEFDDISFSYGGSKASIHGKLHIENATPDDIAQPTDILKKVVGHIDVQLPLAMLHALAHDMAGKLLAGQYGADAEAIAVVSTRNYNDLLGTAMASGYVRLEGDMLVTTVDIHDGAILVNGKPFQLPDAPPPAPVGAVDSGAGPGRLARERRIAAKCALPDFPPEVVAQERPLKMSMRLTVQADGSVAKLMLARSSGFPAYDRAVLAAAARCTYIPALLDGKPVDVRATWDIVRGPGNMHP